MPFHQRGCEPMNFKQKNILLFLLIFSANTGYSHPDSEGPIKICLCLGILSFFVGAGWYDRLSPHIPFIQVDHQGIATQEKQIAWDQLREIQKTVYTGQTNKTVFEFKYAKSENENDALVIDSRHLPIAEAAFFDLLNEYKNKSVPTAKPTFSTAPLTKEQLLHISKTGLYKNEKVVIICYAKWPWNLLILTSALMYGSLIGSACYLKYELKREFIPSYIGI
jgi:hypothetical protein